MALFDKIDEFAKNATQEAKKAGEKAGAFIESKKTEMKINEKKAEIAELKTKIGDIYWEKYNSGESIDLVANELCGQIQGILNDIEVMRNPIEPEAQSADNLAEEKFCQNCGTKLNDNAAFCSNCGMKTD